MRETGTYSSEAEPSKTFYIPGRLGRWLEKPGPVWLATLGPVGNFPVAPGTVGSFVGGLPLAWFLSLFPLVVSVPLLLLLTCWAVRASGSAEKALGREDPGSVIIDEVVGMGVTLIGISFTPASAFLGFAAFRFFDILKPRPIRDVERRTRGGLGVVLDDVAAGVAAHIVVWILLALFGGAA
jgi:phosphatidylglycerophosphatase A